MAAAGRPRISREQCVPAAESLGRAFQFLGKRWTAVLLGHLSGGPPGLRELARAGGGVSASVLSERLSALAAGGLVTRTVDEGPPLSVTYALTESGQALMPALEQISIWA